MKNLFLFVLLCATLPLGAQTVWTRHYATNDTLISIQVLPNGGFSLLLNNNQHVYSLYVDSLGMAQDTLDLGPVPQDIVPAADGGFLTCFIQDTTRLRVQKLDAAGAPVWEQILPDTFPQHTPVLAALPDGGCYVVSANAAVPSAYTYRQTLIQRLDAAGNRLWLVHRDTLLWGYGSIRDLADAAIMPDGSCLVIGADDWNGWHGAGHILRINNQGDKLYSENFEPPTAYVSFGGMQIARPTADTAVLVSGRKWTVSSPAHPAMTSYGYTAVLKENGAVASTTDYPPTITQMGTIYGPFPVAAAPMPAGDMLAIVQKNTDAWLWRGSYDLQDTAWQRPLHPGYHLFPGRMKRPNRVILPTPDQGAVLAWTAENGFILHKTDLWGHDSTVSQYPLRAVVRRDLDQDCQTDGPYEPAPFARVRCTALDGSNLSWTGRTDAQGELLINAPAGDWKLSLADSVAPIFGRNCVAEAVLHVADSQAVPVANLSILRYTARLYGQIWKDTNGNCSKDEPNSGFSGSERHVRLFRSGQSYDIPADAAGHFSVSLDTGWYRLQVAFYRAGPLNGYYCQSDSVYLPAYAAADTVDLIWSVFQNSKLRIKARRDADYDCLHSGSDANWKGFDIRIAEFGSPDQYYPGETNTAGWFEKSIKGPGLLLVDAADYFPDSLLCNDTAHVIGFNADNQVVEDTLLARYPRLHDTLRVCAGTTLWGVPILDTMDIVQPTIFLGEYQIPLTHHILPWPNYFTDQYEPLPPGQTDTLAVYYLTSVHGCDSIIAVHYTTAAKEPEGGPGIRLLPNPAGQFVWLECPAPGIEQALVRDAEGQLFWHSGALRGASQIRIDLAAWPPGVYGCEVLQSGGQRVFARLVVWR
ncbi:MAG: hypothetical protein U0U46_09620 [Saprospiraceae bacterium]